MTAPALAATTRQAVVDALADLAEHYACHICDELAPCEHTPPLGTEAGDDAAWPEAVTAATSAYRGRSDVLGSFLADATVEAPAGATVPTGALYSAWKVWLEANAPDVRPGRTGDFVARLKDRGENVAASIDKGSRTVVRGRRLVADSDGWDVSTPSPEIESSHRDNAGETSETSQTSKNTTINNVCTACSGPLYGADILAGDTTCSTCVVAS